MVVENYAYLFGTVGSAMMTRLPLDELVKPGAVPTALIQYLANNGQWKPGLVTSDVKHLGFDGQRGNVVPVPDKVVTVARSVHRTRVAGRRRTSRSAPRRVSKARGASP